MSVGTASRLLGFASGCAVVFVAALGVGHLVGPVAAEPRPPAHEMDGEGAGADRMAGMDPHAVGGLEATGGGYTLDLSTPEPAPGRARLTFTVVGRDGHAVTAYDEQHERDLHLVVVRRDLTGFQHVHPTLDRATGEWGVDVDLTPGAWRMIADFAPAGDQEQVLGADLLVPGEFRPEQLGVDTDRAQVDGYDVALARVDDGTGESLLTATVTRDGEPVTDLEPYLGAYGHLVALRAGDIGYLHVHPEEGGPGPEIAFGTAFPSAGRYRLFLDFQHAGVVHTAAFTLTVAEVADEH